MDPLIVPASLDALGTVREYVREACAEAGLNEPAAYKLALGVDEIVTNIVTHGYTDDPGPEAAIRLKADITPQEIAVTIDDRAAPYDPRSHELPSPEELMAAAEDRPVGGLGLYLVLQDVDRFDYQSTPQGNRNILAMRRTGGTDHGH